MSALFISQEMIGQLQCILLNDPASSPTSTNTTYTHTSTTTISHAVFMLSWFTTRVYMFPYFVIRSTLFESMVGANSVG